MKLNISDLLDIYQEDALIAEETTPLSMARIQARTMEVVAPPKKSVFRRVVPGTLVAAVIFSILAVTAIAGGRTLLVSDWFRPALNQTAKEDAEYAAGWNLEGIWKSTVSTGQLAAVDDHGRFANQSITREGTTITLVALYGDEYVLHLYFRVEAPAGTVLPDGLDYAFSSRDSYGPVQVPAGYAMSDMYRPGLEAMPDEDPTDNQKDFVVSLHHDQSEQRFNGVLQTQWTFSDDVPKTFLIEGLFYETEDGTIEKLLPGYFTFDITNTHAVNRRQIDVAGYDYSGHISRGEEKAGFSYSVEPIKMTLSPFTAEIENRFTCSEEKHLISMSFQIVFKDGTRERHWQHLSMEAEDGHYRGAVAFTNPIDLRQIDYLLIGDGQQRIDP